LYTEKGKGEQVGRPKLEIPTKILSARVPTPVWENVKCKSELLGITVSDLLKLGLEAIEQGKAV